MNRLRSLHHGAFFLRLIASATLVGFAVSAAKADKTPEVPAHPGKLLEALPRGSAASGWELVTSIGNTEATTWMTSSIHRKLEQKVPILDPETKEPTGEFITHTIEIRMTDTGFHPTALQQFEGWEALDTPTFKRGIVDGRPTTQMFADTLVSLQTLVADRFSLLIQCNGMPREEGEAWISENIDFSKIAQIPRSQRTTLPQPIPVLSINELDPTQNRLYSSSRATDSDISDMYQQTVRDLVDMGMSKKEIKEFLTDGGDPEGVDLDEAEDE